MAITDWPEGDRPREKLISRGVESLSDSELLAIFLRNGVPGLTALDLARELLREFGGLIPLVEADRARFCAARGLGTAKFATLHAVLELGRRYLECRLARGPELSSPRDTRNYLIARLRGHKQEVFACLFLDSRHRLIGFEELFHGTINSASVYPREVVVRALALQAAAVILAHNHPSGDAEPSEADRALTAKLEQALGLIDVRVLDHFVIGESQALSFAERGLI